MEFGDTPFIKMLNLYRISLGKMVQKMCGGEKGKSFLGQR